MGKIADLKTSQKHKLLVNLRLHTRMKTIIDKIYKFCLLNRTFKYYTMNLEPYFRDKFKFSVTEDQYNTSLSIHQKILHPSVHSSKRFNYFFNNAVRFRSTIPVTAKIVVSPRKFEKNLMKHISKNCQKFCALCNQNLNVCVVSTAFFLVHYYFCLYRWDRNNNSSSIRIISWINWKSSYNHVL